MRAGVARLNAMGQAETVASLMRCCASRRWAERVAMARPFAEEAALFAAAETAWAESTETDRLEAFSHHPKIGQRKIEGASAEWSRREQAGMAGASDEARAEFERLNAEYEAKFGFVFLIRATGRSAAEMLAALRSRLKNDRAAELAIAAREQLSITKIRLARMLEEWAA